MSIVCFQYQGNGDWLPSEAGMEKRKSLIGIIKSIIRLLTRRCQIMGMAKINYGNYARALSVSQ
jgi:hypothetical protein